MANIMHLSFKNFQNEFIANSGHPYFIYKVQVISTRLVLLTLLTSPSSTVQLGYFDVVLHYKIIFV